MLFKNYRLLIISSLFIFYTSLAASVPTPSPLSLALQFATFFDQKNLSGMNTILHDDFISEDPAGGRIVGKKSFLEIHTNLFQKTKIIKYKVLNAYQDLKAKKAILEFEITLDDSTFKGVDIVEFADSKIKEIRCYFDVPAKMRATSTL